MRVISDKKVFPLALEKEGKEGKWEKKQQITDLSSEEGYFPGV
jgi:hypothetical protein